MGFSSDNLPAEQGDSRKRNAIRRRLRAVSVVLAVALIAISCATANRTVLGKLEDQRPGVTDVYFVAFAPYGAQDVFRVEGHVEVSRTKSKTRARRLVTACPALSQWLAPYRTRSGLIWTHGLEKFHSDFNALRESLDIPARRNGLRHAFVTYHFALHANENLTAAEVGNSPAMIHAHYKGLATKAEAVKWFKVKPSKSGKNVIPLPAVSRKQAH